MKCPYCGNIDTRVIDSRPADDGTTIRRRRSCDACNKRFTTYEKVETIPLIVIKKDNNREQYDRTKLEGGVLRACYKRPVAAADIQATIDSIETAIFSREEKEIPSSQIGEIVMESLKKLDSVAYVRFASVYREFKDVNTFMDELKKLAKPYTEDEDDFDEFDDGKTNGTEKDSIALRDRRYRGVQDCNTGKYAGKDRIRCESCDDTECNEFYQSAGI